MNVVEAVLLRVPPSDDLPPRERVRIQRETGRRALRCCALRCGAPQEGWRQNAEGAPLPLGGFHWSIAHKRDWAAAVISAEPVGVDLEKLDPRRESLFDEIARPEEWQRMPDRSWPSFFRLWTAKEATLKANSVGIGRLSACRLHGFSDKAEIIMEYEGRKWTIEHFEHDEHIAAATVGKLPLRWTVLDEQEK